MHGISSPDREIVGVLMLPVTDWPFAFGSDRVVLRRFDEDGVMSLAVHSIVRQQPEE